MRWETKPLPPAPTLRSGCSQLRLVLLLVRAILLLLVAALVLVLLLGLLLLLGHLDLLEGRVRVNSKLLGHEPVHPVHERRRVSDIVARLDERRLEEHLGCVQGSCVVLAVLDLSEEVCNNGVVWIDLQGLPAGHHGELILVLERLGLHDLLLLGGIAELRGDNDNRGVSEPLGNLNLFHLHTRILHGALLSQVRELLLPPVGEGLVEVLDLGETLLLLLGLVQLHVGLLDGDKLLALVVGQLLEAWLVEVVREHQDLQVLLLEDLQGRRLLHGVDGVAGHVVDALLALLHPVQVLVEADLLVLGLGGGEAEQLGELGAVGVVLVAAHLEVLVELLPELGPEALLVLLIFLFLLGLVLFLLVLLLLLVIVAAGLLVLRELLHELKHLAHKLLGDDLHDLVLLQLLAGHVQRQVIGVNDATDKAEVAGQQIVKLLGHEHPSNKELDLSLLRPVVVRHVEGGLLGEEEDGLELDLALGVEVRVGQGVEIVLGDGLVELGVLLLRDILFGAQPDCLLRIHLLPLEDGLLRGCLLLVLLLLLVIVLGLDVVLLLLVLVVLVIVVLLGLHVHLLLHLHVDGELDELRVLLGGLLELVLREVVVGVLLEVQGHSAATAKGVATRVVHDCEGGVGAGLPNVLHGVLVALGGHRHLIGHEESGVEAHTELPDEVGIATLGHSLEEVCGAGLRDRPQVVDEVGLGHANARVHDGDGLGLRIMLQPHLQVLGVAEEGLVLDAVETSLLKGICGVGDELAQEDLLVRVEGVDDDVHEAIDLGLELVLLRSLGHLGTVGLAEAINYLVAGRLLRLLGGLLLLLRADRAPELGQEGGKAQEPRQWRHPGA
mmetsp:Transcript_62197/g.140124  ORF Transcript_62197/g.140124 Transcript_62197/m.140124 type:complete len:837 (-) Transcript_62197:74-2584(-)